MNPNMTFEITRNMRKYDYNKAYKIELCDVRIVAQRNRDGPDSFCCRFVTCLWPVSWNLTIMTKEKRNEYSDYEQ